MIVAGIDGATRSGLAIIEGAQLLYWEAFRPKGDTDAEIFNGFRTWLRAALVAHGVQYGAIEEPLRTNFDDDSAESGQGGFVGFKQRRKKPRVTMATFLRLYGIRAHAIEVFHALNIPSVEVNNRTWRSQIYGPTSPPKDVPGDKRSEWWKQKALTHCARVLRWPITSKDAAEAACIAEWRRCQLNPRLAAHSEDLFRERPSA